ncbi:MAG: ORF6N domain-containing protein [Treponema sp.]|nr:ORF6N domain-containing protein [Treponema sp.]MBR1404527.1 ORF6N domain-containing protein [Treponema sp.]
MNEIISRTDIESKILIMRNQQVMIDRDLAELYGVETRRLNEQVKRNSERFPESFCFQLAEHEFTDLMSQNATSSWGGTRKLPYAFTEQGVAMLSAVLRSETAVNVSVQIMNAFVSMRRFLLSNAQVFQRLDSMEKQLIDTKVHQNEADKRIDELFSKMDRYNIEQTQGLFFQGQIFDAYAKFESFILQAEKEIILIDNYVDLSVLERLSKKKTDVKIIIYTDSKTKITEQDIQKFNAQYPMLTVKFTKKMHDRFLIIDGTTMYHIGASLKDLGKKCFAFEVLDASFIPMILKNLSVD